MGGVEWVSDWGFWIVEAWLKHPHLMYPQLTRFLPKLVRMVWILRPLQFSCRRCWWIELWSFPSPVSGSGTGKCVGVAECSTKDCFINCLIGIVFGAFGGETGVSGSIALTVQWDLLIPFGCLGNRIVSWRGQFIVWTWNEFLRSCIC